MILVGQFGVGCHLLQHAKFKEPEWWIACGFSIFHVLFAGIMLALTLGLMSLGLVDLEML